MITKQQYVEHLLATPGNYTCSYLAEHLDETSHDAVSDYLRRERHTARHLWELAEALIRDGPEAYLLVDDSVQNKEHSRKIELVKHQYSGAEHGLVRGIGVVNLVHSSGKTNGTTDGTTDAFYPIDFRIYAPDDDGKTKNEHFREMLRHAFSDKQIEARTVLFDSWYASVDNLKLIHRAERAFITTLKANRLVSLSKETGYIHLDEIEWTPEHERHGVRVKLKEVPFHVQLFKVVAPDGDIDWIITNRLELPQEVAAASDGSDSKRTTDAVQDENAVRWQIEELHRGLKRLCGTEKCQCRKQRSQRNHLALCYHAYLSLKVKADQLGKTLYQMRSDLFREYLRAELRHPRIPALQVT
jgi:hypothetical protein